MNRCAYVFLPEGDELLEVKRAGRHLGDRRCVVIRIAGALEGLVFVATGDETCGKLGRLDQVLGELALDHLVLHLLQDGVLSSLQVLDEDFLALLGRLEPIKLLNQLRVLLRQLLVFFFYLVHFLSILARFWCATIALNARVAPLRGGVPVVDRAARPVRKLLVLGGGRRPDLVLLLLVPQGLLQQQALELLVLLLQLLHVTGHAFHDLFVLSHALLQHVSFELLLVQFTLSREKLLLGILVLLLKEGDYLALILFLPVASRLQYGRRIGLCLLLSILPG